MDWEKKVKCFFNNKKMKCGYRCNGWLGRVFSKYSLPFSGWLCSAHVYDAEDCGAAVSGRQERSVVAVSCSRATRTPHCSLPAFPASRSILSALCRAMCDSFALYGTHWSLWLACFKERKRLIEWAQPIPHNERRAPSKSQSLQVHHQHTLKVFGFYAK